ncbi:MAG: DUF4870 domain-containing protein [Bryobacteraceae bacterium]
MAFCSNCGADTMGGAFCPKCGAPVAAAPPPGPAPGPAPGGYAPYTPPPAAPGAAAGLQENMASALCYVLGLVTGILFLVLQPYNQNKTIRFHAFQSIFYHVAWIIFWFGLHIILSAMGYSVLGALFGLLSLLISLVVGFGGFLLWLFLMWRAYNNNPLVLPIIGPIAQQQAGN